VRTLRSLLGPTVAAAALAVAASGCVYPVFGQPSTAPSSAVPTAQPAGSASSRSSSAPSTSRTTPTSAAAPTTTSGTLTVADLRPKVEAARATAKSVRIKGTAPNQGSQMDVEVAGTIDGTNATIVIGETGGSVLMLRIVAGTVYMQGNEAYYKKYAPTASPARLKGKWIKVPAAQASALTKDLLGLLKLDFLDELSKYRASSVARPVTEDGRSLLRLDDEVGSGAAFFDPTTYLPAKIVSTDSTLSFTEWNNVPPTAAPPAGSVITI